MRPCWVGYVNNQFNSDADYLCIVKKKQVDTKRQQPPGEAAVKPIQRLLVDGQP